MQIKRNPSGERHAAAGAFVAACIYTAIANVYGTSAGFFAAVIGTALIGWLVEVSQRAWGWGTYSRDDIQATATGALIGTLAMGIIGWATG